MARIIGSHKDVDQSQIFPVTVPLVLHRVVKDSPKVFEDINEETFTAIVRHISEDWVTFEDGVEHSDGLSLNWLLTFDDGHASDYEVVFPMLLDMGINAVFFLVTGRVGTPGYLSWEQVREMRKHGMEIGSHGLTHAKMTTFDKKETLKELAHSRMEIEEHLGEPITSFSFPYGYHSNNLVSLALGAGYSTCYTSDHGVVKLPATTIPRNSINSTMSWPTILRVLEPSPLTRFYWKIEDSAKKYIKRILSDKTYQSLRRLISVRRSR